MNFQSSGLFPELKFFCHNDFTIIWNPSKRHHLIAHSVYLQTQSKTSFLCISPEGLKKCNLFSSVLNSNFASVLKLVGFIAEQCSSSSSSLASGVNGRPELQYLICEISTLDNSVRLSWFILSAIGKSFDFNTLLIAIAPARNCQFCHNLFFCFIFKNSLVHQ